MINYYQFCFNFAFNFDLRRYIMVATSLLANLVSNLATLLEYACGSAAAAEQYVLEAGAYTRPRQSLT